ncbi:MAG: LysR family transcriptional regulator [Deltaproteobacteria bacterium]|nr:MAG: LysR family transcriptional regulator [Deltaproteobacteria bacterium]
MKSPFDTGFDWNDLRVFVAIASTGSYTKAARKLGMSIATVSRRLERLEDNLGRKLFRRHSSGLTLTPESEELLEYARSVLDRVFAFARAAEQREEELLEGKVTVTTIESLATKVVAPSLATFRSLYPQIQIILRSEMHTVNLARRSADIALRVVRPKESRVVAQKVARLKFGLFASPVYLERMGRPDDPLHDLSRHEVVTYDERFDTVPEVAWLHTRTSADNMVLRVTTAAAISAAVEAGVGIGVLPLGMVSSKLECLYQGEALPERDVWLVMHEDLQRVPRVRAVFDYLREVLYDIGAKQAGS